LPLVSAGLFWCLVFDVCPNVRPNGGCFSIGHGGGVAGRKCKSRRPVAAGLSILRFATIVLGPLSTQQLRNSQRNRASNRAPPDGATGACKAIPSVETEAGKTHDAMMTAIEHAFGSLTPLLQEYGVTAVMIILMLESIGLPLPGESVLILGSVLAARGDLSFPFLLVFAWAGAVLGDNIGYVIGRTFGRVVLLRVGGRIGLKADRVRKVEAVFARYGPVTVGFARFFPILRQLNGVVAGTLGMEWPRFLLFNALGGALWVLVWSLLGFYLGAHVGDIAELAHDFGMVGAAVAAAVVAAVAWLKWRRRRQSHLQAQSGTISAVSVTHVQAEKIGGSRWRS
jgi:membrane protein DedA with SNARE-associated domain